MSTFPTFPPPERRNKRPPPTRNLALTPPTTTHLNANFEQETNNNMGVEKEILTPAPAGAQKPQKGQKVTVHCTGYGKNRDLSQKFWSTKDPGQVPFSYNIGQGSVIKGWDEGVMDMGVGERAKLTCTPDYAYGEGGFPSWGIMPDSTLCFEIEVLSIE